MYVYGSQKEHDFSYTAFFLATQNNCTIFDKRWHKIHLNIVSKKENLLWNNIFLNSVNTIHRKHTDHFRQQSTQRQKDRENV